MKLWRVYFPIFIIIGSVFLVICGRTFAQTIRGTTLPKNKLDSLSQYYKLSKIDSLPIAQRLDHVTSFLEGAYEYQKDSLIYYGLLQKTWLLNKNKSYDSAIVYSNKLYDFSKKNGDTFYIKKALRKLGIYHTRNDQLVEAFQYYNEAFKISRIAKDSLGAGRNLLYMANIQDVLGDYSGSKTTAIDGLKYIENTADLKSLSGLYHIISIVNRVQENYGEALKYNEKALLLARDTTSSRGVGFYGALVFKNTKANILADQGAYQQAILLLLELMSDPKVVKNARGHARVLDNLGYIKWMENKTNEGSEKLLLEALGLRNKVRDIKGLIASNIHLAKYYFDKDKSKALAYAEAAYNHAKDQHSMTSIMEALGFVFELKPDIDEEAKVYSKIHNELAKMNQTNREIYAVTKYENDKLTTENLILKARTAKKERQRIIYLFGAVIFLLAGSFFIYLLGQRYKRQKIRDVYQVETRISKKIHDEIAGDMYNVMIQMENKAHDPEMVDKLEELYKRTRDFSRENSSFDIGSDFTRELGNMIKSYGFGKAKIVINGLSNLNWQSISPEKKIITYRILQELMINMKKHSKAELVVIAFKRTPKKIKIRYSDNGVGVNMKSKISYNGLRNAENRIKTIGGLFIFDSFKGGGFKAYMNFPV